MDNIVSWIPTNPIEAAATGNMLQIIVFSLIVGVGLLALGRRADGAIGVIAVFASNVYGEPITLTRIIQAVFTAC